VTQSVGFIGLGRIGQQLALNLLGAGFKVTGCDVVARPDFVAAGGLLAGTPRQVADAAQIILQSLPGAEALDIVISGRDGLLKSCGPDHVVADLSFYLLRDKAAAATRLLGRGTTLLDCQITGTPEMLARRAGNIFVSGDPAAVQRCHGAFAAAIDKHTFVSAEFGAATRLKTANNLLVALNTVAAAEALALAIGCGIDPDIAIDVIGSGAAQSQMFAQRAPLMRHRDYPGASSTLASFEIFLDAIEHEVKRSNQSGTLAKAALQIFRQAIADGLGNKDMACVYELVAGPVWPRHTNGAATRPH
jgi:3-hydroxyisobutyrate dehydrogenase-like beta-hydroxyacid dehydrogenase